MSTLPPQDEATSDTHRHLPPPFKTSTTPLTLVTQGAEALVYKTTFLTPDQPAALKVRPPKAWRHPTLDKRLTRQRILAESRVLVKCKKEGVPVPAVLGMSWEEGWMMGEWIEGQTVKAALRQWSQEKGNPGGGPGGGRDEALVDIMALLQQIGKVVGKLHCVGVVHGDLTTSNMMLRPRTTANTSPSTSTTSSTSLDGEIILIDFGLATQAVQEEDRAVDLYVLERAFGSTHPREEGMFGVVLEAYAGSYKGAKATLKRLEDVRMRGRKKSMVG